MIDALTISLNPHGNPVVWLFEFRITNKESEGQRNLRVTALPSEELSMMDVDVVSLLK